MEPVTCRGNPIFLLHILERPETSSDVIEYAVQHNFDAVLVQRFADGGEVLVGAETAVHAAKIAGVVAVAVGLKNREKHTALQPRDAICSAQSLTLRMRGTVTPSFTRGAPQKPMG